MKNKICITLITIFLLSIFEGIPNSSVQAATEWDVTNTNDSGVGSLRQAVASAFAGDTITFSPSLAGQTITLTSTISITKSVTIDGVGLVPRIEISGGDSVRIFKVDATAVTMKNLVLRNGKQTGLTYQYYGAAMFVDSDTNLTIQNILFTNNSAYVAGAIYIAPYANLIISNSKFTNNLTDSDASAIYVKSIGTLKLTNSQLSDNTAGGNGTIYFDGATSLSLLEDNVFSNNTAESGGAVYAQIGNARIEMYNNFFTGNSSTNPNGGGGALYLWRTSTPSLLIIENNTFYSNTATYRGGAVMFSSSGSVYFNNNTMSNNGASQGGNAFLFGGSSFEKIYNNIMANSSGGGDCYLMGSVSMTANNNLIEDGSATCNPNITGDPGLSAPADHGGATETMSISDTSLAWDTGNDAHCTEKDQRGVPRPQSSHCDLGSYELDETGPTISINQPNTQSDPSSRPQLYFTATFDEPINQSTFSPSDISIGGDTGATSAVITEIPPSDGTVFQIAVSGMTNSGVLTVSIEEGVVQDIAANLNEASTSLDNTIEYIRDITPPTVSSIVREGTDPTSEATVGFVVTFSEPVIGVSPAAFSLTVNGLSGTSINGISGTGDVYIVTVNTGEKNGTLRLDLIDEDSILDDGLNPLGGIDPGNGNFNSGETYTVKKTILPAPLLRSPRSGNITNDTTPTFWWTNVKDAQFYEIVFATDSSFTNIIHSNDNGLSPYAPPALTDGTFYWRVRAYNAVNHPGIWSSSRTFTIDTTGPSAPTLSFPTNGVFTSRTPTFKWSPASTATAYEFQYDNDSGFANPNYTVAVRGTSRKPPSMPIGTYFWRVRAKDAAGNWGDWSTPFTINIVR